MRRVSVPFSEKSWIRPYKNTCNTCKICSILVDVQFLFFSVLLQREKMAAAKVPSPEERAPGPGKFIVLQVLREIAFCHISSSQRDSYILFFTDGKQTSGDQHGRLHVN